MSSIGARGAGVAGVLATICLMSAVAAYGQSPADKACPGDQPQHAPFDGRTANFNSVQQSVDKTATLVTDCVEIVGALHEYYVDWPDTNVRDTFTTSGRMSASEKFSDSPTIQSSSLYLGSDRAEVKAGIYRDQTFVEALSDTAKSWVSRFHGSVSTVTVDRPEPERRETLQPVDIEVRLEVDGSVARMSVTDRSEKPHVPLRFSTPPDIRAANGDLPADQLIEKYTVISYPIDREHAVVRHVPLALLNSDRQVIGEIPATVVSGGRR